jgi:hypothetical protein
MLAVEQSDVPSEERIRTLAAELVRDVLRTLDADQLTSGMRRNLAHALLAGALDPADVGDAPLFQVADGTWVPWSAVLAQRDRFGDVWASTETLGPPLDPRRLVFRLDASERALGPLKIIDAAPELEADELARRNRARPPVSELRLPAIRELAVIELTGQVRGLVAPLDPADHSNSRVVVHRGMQPLGEVSTVCDWPTFAIIDDARLVPDRTWSAVVRDAAWQRVAGEVRTASERALERLVAIPDDALASIRVTAGNHDLLVARGALWLAPEPPGARVFVRVVTATGERAFVPKRGIAMAGMIYVHTAMREIDDALDHLCASLHGNLLRTMLARRAELPEDLVAAHATYALRLGRLVSAEVPALAAAPAAPAPGHPLQPLVDALVYRLAELGIHRVTARIAARAEPLLAFEDHALVLAAENARLRSLATSLDSPWFDGALDALAAHAVTIMNIALTEITDATELHALGKLLSRPSAGPPRSRRSS